MDDEIPADEYQLLMQQLQRLIEIVDTLQLTYEEVSLHTGTDQSLFAKGIADSVLARAMVR